ncbi:Na/Pi cotransporter family protein [Atopobacter phocae]|uniref:Na/Pi cotransporter family protein n=1 Tax=Atopobacter phocae TaxID=136492 RepID=UPI0004719B6A|nr:Na/Pi cotransporter family protein [Atopobacter phocae]
MWFSILIEAVAGLGLFLFGMQVMSGGLQKVAGEKMKRSIEVLTSNRFMALIVGTVVTMLIQSSSATSVMVVGFVNAGIMQLSQAFGVILGANVGTTITGQMVALNVTFLAPFAIALGLIFRHQNKSIFLKEFSDVLLGFGILFLGMDYLKNGLQPLGDLPQFKTLIIDNASNPLIGIIIGFMLTVLLQSSSATIGVLIALAAQGLLPFYAAVYIIYGDNIGTCTTALISSIGATRKAKRVAMLHLLFNIFGTLLFLVVLNPFIVPFVESLTPTDIPRQIANIHTFFNIINVIIFFPFANYFIKAVRILVPDDEVEHKAKNMNELDERMLATPSIAVHRVIRTFHDMAVEASSSVNNAILACQTHNPKYVKRVMASEKLVNQFEKRIIRFLVKLSQESLSDQDAEMIDELFKIANDIERISDHSENIADFADEVIKSKTYLDDQAMAELETVFALVKDGYRLTIEALTEGDFDKAEQAIQTERDVDVLKQTVRIHHIERMNKGIATPESGIFVMDLLSNLERISDHYRNVCQSVMRMEGRFKAE